VFIANKVKTLIQTLKKDKDKDIPSYIETVERPKTPSEDIINIIKRIPKILFSNTKPTGPIKYLKTNPTVDKKITLNTLIQNTLVNDLYHKNKPPQLVKKGLNLPHKQL